MTYSSDAFKEAERQLLLFSKQVPNIEAVLNYYLPQFFPTLPPPILGSRIFILLL